MNYKEIPEEWNLGGTPKSRHEFCIDCNSSVRKFSGVEHQIGIEPEAIWHCECGTVYGTPVPPYDDDINIKLIELSEM